MWLQYITQKQAIYTSYIMYNARGFRKECTDYHASILSTITSSQREEQSDDATLRALLLRQHTAKYKKNKQQTSKLLSSCTQQNFVACLLCHVCIDAALLYINENISKPLIYYTCVVIYGDQFVV